MSRKSVSVNPQVDMQDLRAVAKAMADKQFARGVSGKAAILKEYATAIAGMESKAVDGRNDRLANLEAAALAQLQALSPKAQASVIQKFRDDPSKIPAWKADRPRRQDRLNDATAVVAEKAVGVASAVKRRVQQDRQQENTRQQAVQQLTPAMLEEANQLLEAVVDIDNYLQSPGVEAHLKRLNLWLEEADFHQAARGNIVNGKPSTPLTKPQAQLQAYRNLAANQVEVQRRIMQAVARQVETMFPPAAAQARPVMEARGPQTSQAAAPAGQPAPAVSHAADLRLAIYGHAVQFLQAETAFENTYLARIGQCMVNEGFATAQADRVVTELLKIKTERLQQGAAEIAAYSFMQQVGLADETWPMPVRRAAQPQSNLGPPPIPQGNDLPRFMNSERTIPLSGTGTHASASLGGNPAPLINPAGTGVSATPTGQDPAATLVAASQADAESLEIEPADVRETEEESPTPAVRLRDRLHPNNWAVNTLGPALKSARSTARQAAKTAQDQGESRLNVAKSYLQAGLDKVKEANDEQKLRNWAGSAIHHKHAEAIGQIIRRTLNKETYKHHEGSSEQVAKGLTDKLVKYLNEHEGKGKLEGAEGDAPVFDAAMLAGLKETFIKAASRNSGRKVAAKGYDVTNLTNDVVAQVVGRYAIQPEDFQQRFGHLVPGAERPPEHPKGLTYTSFRDDAVKSLQAAREHAAAEAQHAAAEAARTAAAEAAAAQAAAATAQQTTPPAPEPQQQPKQTTQQLTPEQQAWKDTIKPAIMRGDFNLHVQWIPVLDAEGKAATYRAEALFRDNQQDDRKGQMGKSFPLYGVAQLDPGKAFKAAVELNDTADADLAILTRLIDMKAQVPELQGAVVSANISWPTLIQLGDANVLQGLERSLNHRFAETGINPAEIMLEVTEVLPDSLSAEDKQKAMAVLRTFKQAGCQISLDDFEQVRSNKLSDTDVKALVALADEVKFDVQETARSYIEGNHLGLTAMARELAEYAGQGKRVVLERVEGTIHPRGANNKEDKTQPEVNMVGLLYQTMPELMASGKVAIQGFVLAEAAHVSKLAAEKAKVEANLQTHFASRLAPKTQQAGPTPEAQPQPTPQTPEQEAAATAQATQQHAQNVAQTEKAAAELAAKLHASRYNIDLAKASSQDIRQHAAAVNKQISEAYVGALEREKNEIHTFIGYAHFRQHGAKETANEQAVETLKNMADAKQEAINRMTPPADRGDEPTR